MKWARRQLDINYYFNMQPSSSDRYFFNMLAKRVSFLLNFSRFKARRKDFTLTRQMKNFFLHKWSRMKTKRTRDFNSSALLTWSTTNNWGNRAAEKMRWKKIFSLDFCFEPRARALLRESRAAQLSWTTLKLAYTECASMDSLALFNFLAFSLDMNFVSRLKVQQKLCERNETRSTTDQDRAAKKEEKVKKMICLWTVMRTTAVQLIKSTCKVDLREYQ